MVSLNARRSRARSRGEAMKTLIVRGDLVGTSGYLNLPEAATPVDLRRVTRRPRAIARSRSEPRLSEQSRDPLCCAPGASREGAVTSRMCRRQRLQRDPSLTVGALIAILRLPCMAVLLSAGVSIFTGCARSGVLVLLRSQVFAACEDLLVLLVGHGGPTLLWSRLCRAV
jgi:hypothetical protein